MNARRCFIVLLALLALPSLSIRQASAQTAGQAPVHVQSTELQMVLQRLAQQEAEIKQLRAMLESANDLGHTEPVLVPITSNSLHSNNSLASNSLGLENIESISDLHRRIEGLEQRLASYESGSRAIPASPAAPNAPSEVGSDKKMSATWNNGLELKNASGDTRIHIGGASNFDIVAFDTDPALEAPRDIGGIGPNPDSLQLRRARISIDGTFYEVIDYKMEYEFSNFLSPSAPTVQQPVVSSPAFTDFWLQWSKLPGVGNIRAGNQKEPLGLEHMESFKVLDFLERSFLQDIVFGPFNNGFNPGISIFNWSDDQRLTWAIGGFGNNSDPFAYSIGDDWALTARTTYLMMYDEPSQGRYLWEIGASGSVRKPDEDLVRLRSRGNIRSGPPGVLNPILADTGNMMAAQQEILALETAAQWGPWTLQGEYVGAWVESVVQPFAPPEAAVNRGSVFFQGGYIQLLCFLTGEHRAYDKKLAALGRVTPFENAFWVNSQGGHCYGWGAWQIGVRYSALDLNDSGINGGILHAGTFGLNWFLNPNAKVQFNYDVTHRSQVREVAPGFVNGFGTRFAFDF